MHTEDYALLSDRSSSSSPTPPQMERTWTSFPLIRWDGEVYWGSSSADVRRLGGQWNKSSCHRESDGASGRVGEKAWAVLRSQWKPSVSPREPISVFLGSFPRWEKMNGLTRLRDWRVGSEKGVERGTSGSMWASLTWAALRSQLVEEARDGSTGTMEGSVRVPEPSLMRMKKAKVLVPQSCPTLQPQGL